MNYYTFSFFDWMLVLTLVIGTVIGLFFVRQNKLTGGEIKSSKILLLTIIIVFLFGILFWDVFPISLVLKLITIVYWVQILLGFVAIYVSNELSKKQELAASFYAIPLAFIQFCNLLNANTKK